MIDFLKVRDTVILKGGAEFDYDNIKVFRTNMYDMRKSAKHSIRSMQIERNEYEKKTYI